MPGPLAAALPWGIDALIAASEAVVALFAAVSTGAVIYETGKTLGRVLTDIEAQQIKDWINTGALSKEFTEAQAKAECKDNEFCPAGLPPGAGHAEPASWSNYEAEIYRCWATKFPLGLEWFWIRTEQNATWDGFWPLQCRLIEAKGNYAQLLFKNRRDPSGGFFSFKKVEDLFFEQAGKQWAVVKPYHPKVRLVWRFKELEAYKLAGPQLMLAYPGLEAEHYPLGDSFDPESIFKNGAADDEPLYMP